MPRPSFRNAKNIQARIQLDPRSLAEHNAALLRLEKATRLEVVTEALEAGGSVIQTAANAKAPGPHIEIQVMKGSELSKKWRSAGAQGIKPDALYVAIGPDEKHWYYRFAEFGVKAHGVQKRKRTRYQQYASKNKIKRSSLTTMNAAGRKRKAGNLKPAMVFTIDGKLIFTRKVRGYAAKPFLRPAADSQGGAAINAVGAVLKREIEKAAR